MRSDKKSPLKSDKKVPSKVQKKGSIGYNKKSALLEDAITQMNAGKYGRASSALKDLLALDPLNAEARRLFATLHLRLGSLMSARTAFESLAREAMERQDYWLAESLLREYLTAGPRYVPFLEMLGRVYEEKGDVMAAVAEYGKAVEVLLEDPDTDKPNHPSDLFARIRSIAPGSPVAFRLAAMFDTVTGQVLQATPQPSVPASESQSPEVAGAAAPPWEQVDLSPSDMPAAQDSPVSVGESSTDVVESVVSPPSPIEVVEAVDPKQLELDQHPAAETSELPTSPAPTIPIDPSLSPVDSRDEKITSAAESEPPGIDQLAASTGETEAPSSTISPESPSAKVALVEVGADPIAQAPSSPAPMPWDQVEDVAVVIPPASASQGSPVSDDVTPVSPESESVSSLDVDAGLSIIEVQAETGSQSIAEAPSSPVPMAWDQVAEEAVALPPPPANQVASMHASAEVPSPEAELPQAPASEPTPQTIEVLSQSGSHPIVETPTTPMSMPWDQVEENPIPIPPPAAPSVSSVAEVAPESLEKEERSSPAIEAVAPVIEVLTGPTEASIESPSASSPSEITSSGLSWDEILAAVAAMQSSPAPAPTLQTTEPDQAPDRTATDEQVPAATAASDSVEVTAVSGEAPPWEPALDPGSASLTLSAPMPWEQIEVEDVTIPRQEPEPEFGSVSLEVGEVGKAGESGGATQDATLILPAVSETPEPAARAESLTVAAEPSAEVADESVRRFRLVSPDAQNEPPNAHFQNPMETEATLAERSTTLPEIEPSAGLAKEASVPAPLRLIESGTIPPQAAVQLAPVSVEPVTEFTIAVTRDEPVAAEPSEPSPRVEPSMEVITAQEESTLPELAPVDEIVDAPIASAPAGDQSVPLDEPMVLEQQAEAPPDIPAVELSPVVSLEPVSNSDEHGVVGSPAIAAEVPSAEITHVQTDSVQEALPVAPAEMSIAVPADDSSQLVESPQTLEPMQPEQPVELAAEPAVAVESEEVTSTTPAPSDAAPSDGLHILWEDASSAPTPKPSTGNMLTRWLRKSAEPVTPEVSAAPAADPVPVEPLAAVAPPPVEEAVPAAVVAEQPYERVEQVTTATHAEEPPYRPKPIQPPGVGVWSRVGEAAASLVGAGVSTTRSLVVLVLALVGLALLLVGGTVAAVALTWVILEEQPSAAYRTMTSVPQQTLQDSSKNGYLLLLGLAAPANQDPVQAGMDRRVEGADRAFTHTCLTGEGYSPDGGHSASAEAAGKWMKAGDPALQMQLDATGVKTWLSQAEVSLGRYRQWLNKPFEDVGYGQPISPNCGLILQTHRLYLADGFAQDVETGVGRLETDLTAWRTVLGQAKSLPVKMLASAAMNDDVALMSGLLQRPDLDERYVSRMAKLARPLEQSEQSLRWPMQSQFVLATKTLDEVVGQDRADTRPFYGAIAAALPLPKQRRFNAYAEYYDAAGKAAADGRFADLPKHSQFVRVPPYGVSDMVMNPIESLVGVDPLPTWGTYAGRVLETDARLRLVSLQAWLRRTPSEQDLLTRLAKAGQGLYDPFTGLPMLVNMKKGVLYSVGPDLKDNEAYERLDLVVQIPSVAWVGAKKPADGGKSK